MQIVPPLRHLPPSRTGRILAAVLVLAATCSVAYACYDALFGRGSLDFVLTYVTVRMMLSGVNPYQVRLTGNYPSEIQGLRDEAANLLGRDSFFIDPDYLPSALLGIVPFTLFPLPAARILWLAGNLAAAGFLIVAAFRYFSDRSVPWQYVLVVASLFLCSTPFQRTVGLGQFSILTFALAVAAVLLARQGKWKTSGVFAAASLLKYTVTWPLFLFLPLLTGTWKIFALAVGIHVAVHLVLTSLMGAHPVWVISDIASINADVFYRAELFSLWSALRLWLSEPYASAIGVLCLTLLLIGLAYRWRTSERHDMLAWLSILPMTAMLGPGNKAINHVYLLFTAVWLLCLHRIPAHSYLMAAGIAYFLILRRAVLILFVGNGVLIEGVLRLEDVAFLDLLIFLLMYAASFRLLERTSASAVLPHRT